jgi:hypothetical protein
MTGHHELRAGPRSANLISPLGRILGNDDDGVAVAVDRDAIQVEAPTIFHRQRP